MKILVLGLNYAPERIGIAVYTTGMAEALVAMGHEVQVIAGRPYYPGWKIMDGHSAWTFARGVENGVDVTRAPHYIPAHPSGLRRLLHHASFALSSLVPILARAWTTRPDVVIAIAPSLAAAPIARLAAWMSGARSWLHVQDFEAEAAFATGLLNRHNWIGRLAVAFENWVLGQFDRVSSISPQMCSKLAEKGVPPERIVEFRNWADVEAIQPLSAPSVYRAEWSITAPHVALYSGNIGGKQGIEIVVEAARRLEGRADLTFVICGQGPNRAKIQAEARGLSNIQFHDLQPMERLNDLLGLATIHLLPQLAGAADLVLPSKLANMLASGRPVVATAAADTGLAREVEGCGVVTPPADAGAFAAAICRLMDDPALWSTTCKAARQRAEQRWSGALGIAAFARELHMFAAAASPLTSNSTKG